MPKVLSLLVILTSLSFMASTAKADFVSISTSAGATNPQSNQAVKATANFSVNSPGLLTILIVNNITNPNDVSQNISDLFFHVTGINSQTGSLTGSHGDEVTINSSGGVTNGPSVDTGWTLLSNYTGPGNVTGLELTVLGTQTAPTHTIVGGGFCPGVGTCYSNANPSIAGNTAHNPFLSIKSSFDVSIPGLTSVTQISNVNFSFGTTAGVFVPAGPQSPPTSVPEPTTMLLLGTGLAGLGVRIRRRQSN